MSVLREVTTVQDTQPARTPKVLLSVHVMLVTQILALVVHQVCVDILATDPSMVLFPKYRNAHIVPMLFSIVFSQ
jgi:hypothetical protein